MSLIDYLADRDQFIITEVYSEFRDKVKDGISHEQCRDLARAAMRRAAEAWDAATDESTKRELNTEKGVSMAKMRTYPMPAKCDIQTAVKIDEWKEGGHDHPITGFIQIYDSPENAKQFIQDMQTMEILVNRLANGMSTFHEIPISKIARLLEENPSYLFYIEHARQLLRD
ncbi:MAG: hypothetical protein Q8R40_02795 [bacterium]|nr:hypothetical protein [bacterium]